MRKWIHNLLKGASLTTALFIFEACYGPPMDYHDYSLDFRVVSSLDGQPLKDVNVSMSRADSENGQWMLCGQTGETGDFTVYWGTVDSAAIPSPKFRFESPDGSYAVKDTTFTDLSHRRITIALEKAE